MSHKLALKFYIKVSRDIIYKVKNKAKSQNLRWMWGYRALENHYVT